MNDEEMAKVKEKGIAKEMALAFIAEIVTALVFSYFLYALGVVDVTGALVVAFWTWLGFAATLQFGGVLWGGQSITLFLINTSHRLVSFILIVITLVLI